VSWRRGERTRESFQEDNNTTTRALLTVYDQKRRRRRNGGERDSRHFLVDTFHIALLLLLLALFPAGFATYTQGSTLTFITAFDSERIASTTFLLF
jgi:cytochrome b561